MVRIGIKHERCPLPFSLNLQKSPFKNGEWLFRPFMRAQNGIKMVTGKLFSEFLGINWQTGEKGVTDRWDMTICLIELRKRQWQPRLGHHFKSDMLHHFVLNACEVQRFHRLSCFGTRDTTCESCAGFLPSLASSTENPWSVVSAPEIGSSSPVLSVS